MTDALSPCRVLVLGAGLAGHCAAIAARQAAPGASVVLACPGAGPSGSSFRNRNDRLGVHAPQGESDARDFGGEALRFGAPGSVDPALVAVLAREADERLDVLLGLGATALVGADGSPARFPSCFSPESDRAVILTDLASLFRRLHGRAADLGVTLRPGLTAATLVRDGDRVVGAVLLDAAGKAVFQPAGAIIAAMGGPVPLFARHMAGPGNPGFGHGLLVEAGARLANTGYLQWMWYTAPGGRFFPLQDLLAPGWHVTGPDGVSRPVPETVAAASGGRGGHCPLGHGLADALLDRFVLAAADGEGLVGLTDPSGRTLRVTLLPQAANGGAVIDAWGRTSVAGLYAAGECATGMHGANRVGGAMVAACLVFGHRAGVAAAGGTVSRPNVERSSLEAGQAAVAACRVDAKARRDVLDGLGRLLTAQVSPWGSAPGLVDDLGVLATSATADTLATRAVQAGIALAEGLA